MNLIVTATELWASIEAGFTAFITHPAVKQVGIWLDNGMVVAAIIVFFKYILPKLRENEANKERAEIAEANLAKITSVVDTFLQKLTGIEFHIEDRVNGLIQVINTAFQNSNLDTKAKVIIGTVVQQMLLGQPVDLAGAAAALGDDAKATLDEATQAVTAILQDTKQSAVQQLADEIVQLNTTLNTTQEG